MFSSKIFPRKQMMNNVSADLFDEDETHSDISQEKNKVMFYSEVDTHSCFKLINCLTDAKKFASVHNSTNEFNDDMKIYLHICSDGGDVFSALSVIDFILKSKVDIVTVCEGSVASAGVLISLAGKERYIREHAYMLIHEIRSGCLGKYSEMQEEMKNNDKIMDDLKKYMNERCNNKLLRKKMDKVLKKDILWDANRCIKYGLVEKIV